MRFNMCDGRIGMRPPKNKRHTTERSRSLTDPVDTNIGAWCVGRPRVTLQTQQGERIAEAEPRVQNGHRRRAAPRRAASTPALCDTRVLLDE